MGGRLIRYPAEVDSEERITTDEESQLSDMQGNNGSMEMSEEVHAIKHVPERAALGNKGNTRDAKTKQPRDRKQQRDKNYAAKRL